MKNPVADAIVVSIDCIFAAAPGSRVTGELSHREKGGKNMTNRQWTDTCNTGERRLSP